MQDRQEALIRAVAKMADQYLDINATNAGGLAKEPDLATAFTDYGLLEAGHSGPWTEAGRAVWAHIYDYDYREAPLAYPEDYTAPTGRELALVTVLVRLVLRYLWHDGDIADSYAMSAGEHAIEVLCDYGLMELDSRGRICGQWTEAGIRMWQPDWPKLGTPR